MNTSSRLMAVAVLAVAAVSSALAAPYSAGPLEFETAERQSIWGPGQAVRFEDSFFLGAEWSNATASIGDIAGSAHQVVIPATPAVTTQIWEPRILGVGCGCYRNVTIVPRFDGVTADTRTGAELTIQSSGKVGLEFGYLLDAGSIGSTAGFGATAELPELVNAAEFFSINTDSLFQSGAIDTQSPKAEAYVSAIVQLSGSIDAKACFIGSGCVSGGTDLPTVDMDQRILSIDPGSLKILDGLLPPADGDPLGERQALAEVPILNRALTLEGGLSATGVPGFKLTETSGATLLNTMPPVPSVSFDLAELEANVPDIVATGVGDGTRIFATGRDDVLSLQGDIDGLAALTGALPPGGASLTLIDLGATGKFEVSFDLIDVDAGPVLGLKQDFELTPTLMVDFEFSNPVQIAGLPGERLTWSGLWSDLPDFAISRETIFTPTFWLDATLRSLTGLDLGLVGTLDILKLGATATFGGFDLLHFNDISLNSLLGWDNKLFETDKLFFPVFDETFALEGFNRIAGRSFTLGVAEGPMTVPEPASLWLMLSGLCGLLLCSRRTPRRPAATGHG